MFHKKELNGSIKKKKKIYIEAFFLYGSTYKNKKGI